MKDETKVWLKFAEENLKSSKILLKSHLYNPSLQNTQQTAEKSLKAIFIEKNIKLKRTHDILELVSWHPSKLHYTFLDHSPFAGAFSQKTVKYFGDHMKGASKFIK